MGCFALFSTFCISDDNPQTRVITVVFGILAVNSFLIASRLEEKIIRDKIFKEKHD